MFLISLNTYYILIDCTQGKAEMNKASKWMISFLLGGKREEKDTKKKISNSSYSEEYVTKSTSNNAIVPSTTNTYKRRWSFGRSSKKNKSLSSSSSSLSHNAAGSKSLDSMATAPIAQRAIAEIEKERLRNCSNVIVSSKPEKRRKSVSVRAEHAAAVGRMSNVDSAENAAATKIQAAFKSYLAKRALHALRSLVKLQALVRGHLVRKQVTSTLRQMHTLMAIQVRARFQRIQMADQESYLVTKTRSASGRKSVNRTERRQHGITTYYSGDLSLMSKRENQYEEFCFTTSHNNSPRNHSPVSKLTPGRASFGYYDPSDYSNSPFQEPYYMANTKSSRAKIRSQSEPRQRPKLSLKPYATRNASMDAKKAPLLDAQTQMKLIAKQNQDPWFIKHYRPSKLDSEYDGSYCNSVIAYEPHVAMY